MIACRALELSFCSSSVFLFILKQQANSVFVSAHSTARFLRRRAQAEESDPCAKSGLPATHNFISRLLCLNYQLYLLDISISPACSDVFNCITNVKILRHVRSCETYFSLASEYQVSLSFSSLSHLSLGLRPWSRVSLEKLIVAQIVKIPIRYTCNSLRRPIRS